MYKTSLLSVEVTGKDALALIGFLLSYKNLIDQIDMSDYKDAQGHKLKMNSAYINAVASISDVLKEWEEISKESD